MFRNLLLQEMVGATTHHGNVAGAGTTVDTVAKGGVLPEMKQIARDRASESKAAIFGACEVPVATEGTLGLIPMELDRWERSCGK